MRRNDELLTDILYFVAVICAFGLCVGASMVVVAPEVAFSAAFAYASEHVPILREFIEDLNNFPTQ